jgi:hypothetical protein
MMEMEQLVISRRDGEDVRDGELWREKGCIYASKKIIYYLSLKSGNVSLA